MQLASIWWMRIAKRMVTTNEVRWGAFVSWSLFKERTEVIDSLSIRTTRKTGLNPCNPKTTGLSAFSFRHCNASTMWNIRHFLLRANHFPQLASHLFSHWIQWFLPIFFVNHFPQLPSHLFPTEYSDFNNSPGINPQKTLLSAFFFPSLRRANDVKHSAFSSTRQLFSATCFTPVPHWIQWFNYAGIFWCFI